MVDYCLVPFEELANIENFMVRTMSQCEAHLCVSEEGLRVPDDSVLMWDLLVADCTCMANLTEASDKGNGGDVQKKYLVPEGYMLGETKFTECVIAGLRAVRGNQYRLDAVYEELLTGLKAGLKELATMRKELHRSESRWLQSKAGDDGKQMRNKYLEMR